MSIKQVFTMTEVITIVAQVVADIELRAKKHAPETAAVIVGATLPEHRVAGIAFALDLGTVPEAKPDPEWKAEHNFEAPKKPPTVKLGMCTMPPPVLGFVPMDPATLGPPKKIPMALPPSMAAQKAMNFGANAADFGAKATGFIDYLSTPAVSAAVDAAYQQMKKTLATVATPGFKVVLEPVAFDPMKCSAGVDLGPLLSGMKFDLQHLKKWKADDTNSVSAGKVVDTAVAEFLTTAIDAPQAKPAGKVLAGKVHSVKLSTSGAGYAVAGTKTPRLK